MIHRTSHRMLTLLAAALAGLVAMTLCMLPWASHPTRNVLLSMTIVQNVLVFIVPALVVVWLSCPRPGHVMGLDVAPTWRALALVLAVYVVSLPALNYAVHLNESMRLPQSLSWLEQMMRASEDAAQQVTKQLLGVQSWPAMLFTVFAVGIMAGVGEEFFFRGAMLGMWREKGVGEHLGVWVVAIVFSAIHMQFFGFVPRMLIGVWLGYLFVWTRSLWVPIVAHALNNGMVVVFTFLNDRHLVGGFDIDRLGVPEGGQTPWLAIASATVTLALVFAASKALRRRTGTAR